MSSFGRLLALALAAVALRVGAAAAQLPAALVAAVRASVATEWAADSAAVQLDWGAVPPAAALGPSTPFRLVGKGTDGWYVALFEPDHASPVAIRVRAGALDTVTVAARPLAVNTTLAPADLRRDVRVRWGAPAAAGVAPSEGWITRRPIAAGEPITAASAAPPQLVKSGAAVRLEWQRGGVVVALAGVALGSGVLGETVRVRLAERGGQRSGRIVGPNAVRLDS